MKEIILDNKNIGSLEEDIQNSEETEISLFFPEYFYPEINEKESVPEYNEENIKKIENAKKIASDKGIKIITNYKSYDYIVPKYLNRDDFSNAKIIFEDKKYDNPSISIIIPTCNRKDYLKKTLNALFSQDYKKEYEIIVVDDGSDDGTDVMIKGLGSPVNLKHIYWPRNKPFVCSTPTNRVGPARNLGVKYCIGNILIFLDADIIANKKLIKEYVASVDENSIVLAPSIREREKLDKRENYFALCNDEIDRLSIKWTLLHSGNFCVHKTNFDKVGGFDKDFVFYGKEDEELGYKFYKLGLNFKLNRRAYGIHLYHEPEYINETLKKIMHFYQVKIFYKKYLDKEVFYRFKHRMSPHLINAGTLCNNNCGFCNKLQRKSFKDKSTEEIMEEINVAKRHGLNIILGGGEPAIRSDFRQIIAFCKSKSIIPEILTNGRVFALEKYINILKENDVKKVMVYFFSSDKDSYEKLTKVKNSLVHTLAGIRNLINSKFDVSVNLIITKNNYKELNSMIKLNDKLRVKNVHISILPEKMSKAELKEVADCVNAWQNNGNNIIFRDAFLGCLKSSFEFKNKQTKEETCARCILKENCPLEKKAFIRIDDVEEKTDNLKKLVNILISNNIPFSLQIVPKNVTKECVDWILELKQKYPLLIEIGQHGWSHENYDETLQENYEFGPKRSYDEQFNDIKKGYERMKELFGTYFEPIFTPPYHGYNKDTIKILQRLGFKIISIGKGKTINGIRCVKCEIDPLYYSFGNAKAKDAKDFMDELEQGLDSDKDIGIVLHPQYLSENWQFVLFNGMLDKISSKKIQFIKIGEIKK